MECPGSHQEVSSMHTVFQCAASCYASSSYHMQHHRLPLIGRTRTIQSAPCLGAAVVVFVDETYFRQCSLLLQTRVDARHTVDHWAPCCGQKWRS